MSDRQGHDTYVEWEKFLRSVISVIRTTSILGIDMPNTEVFLLLSISAVRQMKNRSPLIEDPMIFETTCGQNDSAVFLHDQKDDEEEDGFVLINL
jgi:hypothetical protein